MADEEQILTGDGFALRPWRAGDAVSLAANADNRNVWSNLRTRFPRPYTLADARTWISRCASGRDRGVQLAIEVDGLAVGGIGVDLVTTNNPRTGELGYWLGEDYWGRGIAGNAVRLVCPLAFRKLTLDRLRAIVRSSNEASLRILARSGFEVESKMRRSGRRPGSAVVEIVYARNRAAVVPPDEIIALTPGAPDLREDPDVAALAGPGAALSPVA